MDNIAVIMTCHNRRDKTLAAVGSLLESAQGCSVEVNPVFYITDDGCTDGTVEALLSRFGTDRFHIIEGDGSLYWAGGMRKAWTAAANDDATYGWKFYFLYNDDTRLFPDGLEKLFCTHSFCLARYGRPGMYSGLTCSFNDSSEITYGGEVLTGGLSGCLLGRTRRLGVSSEPRECDFANANALLLSAEIVRQAGIFHDGYCHSCADYDYSFLTRRKGIPVLTTADTVGECDYDHSSPGDIRRRILSMSLRERRRYYEHPLHSNRDYELMVRRTQPLRYPFVWVLRRLNVYCPRIYYFLNGRH